MDYFIAFLRFSLLVMLSTVPAHIIGNAFDSGYAKRFCKSVVHLGGNIAHRLSCQKCHFPFSDCADYLVSDFMSEYLFLGILSSGNISARIKQYASFAPLHFHTLDAPAFYTVAPKYFPVHFDLLRFIRRQSVKLPVNFVVRIMPFFQFIRNFQRIVIK